MAENPFVAALRRYRRPSDGALLFVREVFGAAPDLWQEQVLRWLSSGERGITVRSGHGVGKSTVASWGMAWRLFCFQDTKVVVTAPSAGQLFDALFAELKSWIRRMPLAWQELVTVKADRIALTADPDRNFVSARTARAESPEALQGVHAAHVLLVVDEASGVPEAVFEAARGSMSSENATTLLLGNPTRSSGFFYDTHTRNKAFWKTLRVSSTESSRVSPKYAEEVARDYGEDSNAYRIRVLGEFPKGDDDTVIALHLAEAAVGRDVTPGPEQGRVWGLDCARMGDDQSVLTRMWGRSLETLPESWKKLTTMQLVGRVKQIWDQTPPSVRPVEINVDAIGLGAGVADRLAELGLPARSINVAEAPSLKGQYRNLRTELWFKGREWFESRKGSLPEGSDRLIADLVSVRYGVQSNGALFVEPKAETKKRLRRSPDFADSFLLCLASDAVTASAGRNSTGWGKPLRRRVPMP